MYTQSSKKHMPYLLWLTHYGDYTYYGQKGSCSASPTGSTSIGLSRVRVRVRARVRVSG